MTNLLNCDKYKYLFYNHTLNKFIKRIVNAHYNRLLKIQIGIILGVCAWLLAAKFHGVTSPLLK